MTTCMVYLRKSTNRKDKQLNTFDEQSIWVNKVLLNNNEAFQINWNESGKPQVNPDAIDDLSLRVSLSHDDSLCVCSAADFEQGCDIEPIEYRTEYQWSSLLNGYNKKFIELSEIVEKNIAGTIIWSIGESIKKTAIFKENEKLQINLIENDDSNYLFRVGNNENQILVIARIFSGTRGGKKIFSCIVREKKIEANSISSEVKEADIIEELKFEKDIFTCTKRGKFNEEIYMHRFRTTFKEANQIDRTVHYPNFAFWMGQLRELPLKRISNDLIKDMSSGKWGMVTNNSYIKIIGEAKTFDLIEGHFWVSKCYGKHNSTIDLVFTWNKVETNGKLTPIAYSFLPSTWVKVIKHGVVEVDPFPQYFQNWVNDLVAQNDNTDYLEQFKSYSHKYDCGDLLFKNNKPANKKIEIHKSTFNTSLNESNLVGNIYYGNYYKWQAEVFDEFIHQIDPTFYQTLDRKFSCLETEVQHLREAMPFDKIEARLYVDNIYEKGFDLSCDFYCINRKESEKLASGKQKVAFLKKENENYRVSVIEEEISKHFR